MHVSSSFVPLPNSPFRLIAVPTLFPRRTTSPSILSNQPPQTPVLTSASTVTFKNESDGKDIELDVRGTWYDRSASVTFGGEFVAYISRSMFDMREIFADKDTVSSVLSFRFLFLSFSFFGKGGVGDAVCRCLSRRGDGKETG